MGNTKENKNRLKKYFILFVALLLTGFWLFQLSGHELDSSLKKLTADEKSKLRRFFDKAIKKSQLGHILFFPTKPACFFIIDQADNQENLFRAGWNVWKSKESLFPHPNFIIYEEICENKIYVYFINKQTLLSQLKEGSLKQLFGNSFSLKGFVDQLEHKTWPTLVCKNHLLLGILLGYGIESSMGFGGYIDPTKSTSNKELSHILCAASGKIEMTELENGMTHCTFKSKVRIYPVAFIGDPESNEVKNLKETYSQELEQIEMLCQREDFLQFCLERLCQFN